MASNVHIPGECFCAGCLELERLRRKHDVYVDTEVSTECPRCGQLEVGAHSCIDRRQQDRGEECKVCGAKPPAQCDEEIHATARLNQTLWSGTGAETKQLVGLIPRTMTPHELAVVDGTAPLPATFDTTDVAVPRTLSQADRLTKAAGIAKQVAEEARNRAEADVQLCRAEVDNLRADVLELWTALGEVLEVPELHGYLNQKHRLAVREARAVHAQWTRTDPDQEQIPVDESAKAEEA